jgi:hypothetical protein
MRFDIDAAGENNTNRIGIYKREEPPKATKLDSLRPSEYSTMSMRPASA